ncbi:proteasome assembly chaperone 2 [Caerostris extrusa]|uniref:Proteasome assembly chaperone 2 n=1 Tax=Caerostris extrusa TaxID=172846 RepID=A0AAV4NSD2_CAEEX|nr:proteasome assembly chaperone 2 [Caerostris extrusa]
MIFKGVRLLHIVPAHFLSSSSFSDTETLVNLQWKKFALHPKINPKETSSIPGGGIAKFLLEDCEKEGIPFVILILVCSEGNNYPEAFQMVERLNDWLNLKQKEDSSNWKMPISWTLPYGNAAPKTIY